MKINVKKLIIKVVASILATAIFLVGYYFVYLYCGYQRRPDMQDLRVTDRTEQVLPLNQQISLMTYNIGFGAYSDDF